MKSTEGGTKCLEAKMGKKIGVLVEFNYEELEVWYPLLRFREEEGFQTVAIGPEKGKVYQSKCGYKCQADFGIDEVSAQDLDAIIVPGGWAPDYLRRDKRVLALVADMFNAGKLVGSICHGPWVLCSAKIVKGKRMTCFSAIKDDIENAGALYEDAAVVVDGNLITSRVPGDLPIFCKTMLGLLNAC